MIRSTYRNLMLGLLVVSFGVSFYVFRMTQDKQVEIADRQNDITRLNQELENAQTLNVALTELDGLTITEQTATQLDILRHLGLEQSELEFQLESRDVRTIGNTSLYIHSVRISGRMPYETALALCDRLQNTKKIMLDGISLTSSNEANTSDIDLTITGKIYGLDKTIPVAPEVPAEPVAGPTDASVTTVSSTAAISTTTGVSASMDVSVTQTTSLTSPVSGSTTVLPKLSVSTSIPVPESK